MITTRIQGPASAGFASASHLTWWLLIAAVGLLTTSRWTRRTAAAE
ncbi:hypothetical protein [Saccharopolyspora shandongensis]